MTPLAHSPYKSHNLRLLQTHNNAMRRGYTGCAKTPRLRNKIPLSTYHLPNFPISIPLHIIHRTSAFTFQCPYVPRYSSSSTLTPPHKCSPTGTNLLSSQSINPMQYLPPPHLCPLGSEPFPQRRYPQRQPLLSPIRAFPRRTSRSSSRSHLPHLQLRL